MTTINGTPKLNSDVALCPTDDGPRVSAAAMEKINSAQHTNQIAKDLVQPAPAAGAKTGPTSDLQSTQVGGGEGYGKDPLEELKNNPEYQDLQKLLQLAEQLESGGGLYDIDAQFAGALGWGKNDGLINWGNIEEAAEDSSAPGHAAAKMLMQNRRLFSLIDANGDQLISAAELRTFIGETKAKIGQMEKEAKDGAAGTPVPAAGQADQQQVTTAAGSKRAEAKTANANKDQGGTDLDAEFNKTTPLPEPSQNKSLEGAAENMNNVLGWTESEISRLSELYAKAEGNPALQKKIENRMNELSRKAQQVAAMMNQIMTMLSNISKMQSDIAMNAIRNMR